jgi:hypothetical protein
MNKRAIDISSYLEKKQKKQLVKHNIYLSLGVILLGIVLVISSMSMPWHWQLFLHWIGRKGNVYEISAHLHPSLNELCYRASAGGIVNGYQGSREIAYSLGKFQCLPADSGDRWLIRDTYRFDNLREAMAGFPLAAVVVYFWGQDYAYNIESSIPKK